MYLLKRKYQGTTRYYLCKSYRDFNTGKNSSKIIEKLGTNEDLKRKHGDNWEKWLESYIKEQTKSEHLKAINFNSIKKINRKNERYYSGGYFALKSIAYKLNIDKILGFVKAEEHFEGKLLEIFLGLIYDRIMFPDNTTSLGFYCNTMIENFDIDKKELKAAIKILSKHQSYIQSEIFWASYRLLKTNTSIVFNQCINFCFDMNKGEKSVLKMVQLDIFYDKNGFPIAFFNNSEEEKKDENISMILDSFQYLSEKSNIVCFADNLPSKMVKKLADHNIINYLTEVNIRNLKKNLQKWILNDNDWIVLNNRTKAAYRNLSKESQHKNISKIKRYENYSFYKVLDLKENNKCLVVSYSYRKKITDRTNRYAKYSQIHKLLDNSIAKEKDGQNTSLKDRLEKLQGIIKETINEDNYYEFDNENINKNIAFDGYDAFICDANLADLPSIIWAKENNNLSASMFKTLKIENSYVPGGVSIDESVNSHLLVSFTSLLILRILQDKCNYKYSIDDLRAAMIENDFIKFAGVGWMPAFMPNQITDALDKICGIETDWEIISEEDMKGILKHLTK